MDYKYFDHQMSMQGWVVFENILPKEFCDRLRDDVARHVARCGELQVKAGIPGAPDGTAHHAVGFGDSLDEFLEKGFLADYIEHFFGGLYILHALNPIINYPEKHNYVQRIHNDAHINTSEFRMQLNLLVMVDEFTLENGATHIISGSQFEAAPPPESLFYQQAERLIGPQGSIVIFDSRLWHAAGKNYSANPRAALTMSLCRPFIKPQMDYARMLGPEYGATLSKEMRQLLGYNARVPTNLHEWYQPEKSRMYYSNQG